MGLWISLSVQQQQQMRKQFDSQRKLIEQRIANANQLRERKDESQETGHWKGYREFVVDKLVPEAESITSVYLQPIDGKPISTFLPGQHLSFRFAIPGEPKPMVRCYSLSNRPGDEFYRISVKAAPSPPDRPELPAGKVSNYINNQLMENDRLLVRAPSGSFHLDDAANVPVVMLAGGIGITPMVSMLEYLANQNSQRRAILFYGVRSSKEHAFKTRLKQISSSHPNFHVVTCYSNPQPSDQLQRDFDVPGFVSIDLLRKLLPDQQYHFYLCGPPAFMESLHGGLKDWGVPDQRIRFEAFGPATIKKKDASVNNNGATSNTESKTTVKFVASDKSTRWDSTMDSILELAEANEIPIDSGCRAGSCGTCATKLLKGQVVYPRGMEPDCEPGHCLACISKPTTDVELEV